MEAFDGDPPVFDSPAWEALELEMDNRPHDLSRFAGEYDKNWWDTVRTTGGLRRTYNYVDYAEDLPAHRKRVSKLSILYWIAEFTAQ
jgi:hypothetical protein